jgi:hypothetical protein
MVEHERVLDHLGVPAGCGHIDAYLCIPPHPAFAIGGFRIADAVAITAVRVPHPEVAAVTHNARARDGVFAP